MKTFTLEEAQALLPVLESLLTRAMKARRSAVEIEGDLQRLSQRIFLSGGMHVDVPAVNQQRQTRDQHIHHSEELVAEIEAIGVVVKDLDSGLLDFPCRLNDEVVLLCWKYGEQGITHWHTLEDGFLGRKPIDDRFRSNRPN